MHGLVHLSFVWELSPSPWVLHLALTVHNQIILRGNQWIVSVNYLFGRPLIPYDFLKGIFTTNFRDVGNLRPSVLGLTKMSFRVPKKGQLRFSERK